MEELMWKIANQVQKNLEPNQLIFGNKERLHQEWGSRFLLGKIQWIFNYETLLHILGRAALDQKKPGIQPYILIHKKDDDRRALSSASRKEVSEHMIEIWKPSIDISENII